MIILEGPDGAGKTTLLLNLLDEFPSIEQHEKASTSTGGPVDNIAFWAKVDIQSWLLQPLSFYDRHPMFSEPIYGQILREGKYDPWFLGSECRRVGQTMMEKGLIVMCLPPLDLVIENLKSEEQLSGVEDNIFQLWSNYSAHLDYFSQKFPNSIFHYDYTQSTDFDELLTMVEAHQVRWNRRNKGRK